MPKIPSDLVARVQKQFAALGKNSVVGDVDQYLAAFTGAASYITVDSRPLDKRSNPFEKKFLTPEVAWKVASLVSWLFVELPVGDPVRAGIPEVVTALQKVLADKRNVWVLESKYYDEERPQKRAQRHAALTELVGGKVVKGKKPSWVEGRDDGTLILAPASLEAANEDAMVFGALYTAKFSDATRDRVTAFALAASDGSSEVIPLLEHIRSAGFTALGARVAKTTVPVGGYEANPLASAPALVAKVAAASKISSDAAVLYLQTRTLPHPSKARVLVWNAWTTETYEAAAAALLKAKLVVTAKVDGAGRKIFAPGPIVKKTKLNAPIEQSKLAFITHGRFIKHLITEPCHLLFERV